VFGSTLTQNTLRDRNPHPRGSAGSICTARCLLLILDWDALESSDLLRSLLWVDPGVSPIDAVSERIRVRAAPLLWPAECRRPRAYVSSNATRCRTEFVPLVYCAVAMASAWIL
jgi:hypothetical protein